MASFSLSRNNLTLTPPFTPGGPKSNYAVAGQAVNAANIWKYNRAGAPNFASMVAQNSASETNIYNAMQDAKAEILKGGLQGYTSAIIGKKTADRMKEQAKDQASKSMWSDGLGAVATIGGTLLSGGNPMVGMIAGKGASALGGFLG